MAWAAQAMSEWTSPENLDRLLNEPSATIQEPGSSSEERPSIWATVLNAPVETQIESTLTALAMLIARRGISDQLEGDRVDKLSEKASRVDAETTKLIEDEIRNHGWRSACHAVRARAASSGYSLHVEYASPMFDAASIRRRMGLARHVYNTFPGAGRAIDQVVGVLTQNWMIGGPVPEQVLQATRDSFEASSIPSLTAHTVRDGLVCGVGALSMQGLPVRNPWLLTPESIETIVAETATIESAGTREKIHPVLPMFGARQVGSEAGLSLLEPLVVSTSNYDLYLRSLLEAKIMQESPAAQAQLGDRLHQMQAFAESQLRSLQATAATIFNPPVLRLPVPTPDLYIPGAEEMVPAVGSISLGPNSQE